MKHITSIELLENDYILIVCDDGKKYAALVDLWYLPVSEIRPRFFSIMERALKKEGYNYKEAFVLFVNAVIEKLTPYTKETVLEYYS